ncbi:MULTISPECIES: HAD-IA family hydrolase [Acinetobacter]|uniref:HAD-IA family hydrolase n=1 Tax=Acinetobacter TaxID=469 RepID=UPI002002ACFF|nr:HAD-IA family hydrolase [Acinetobacter radioresistens]MCK4080483.1 HAD-IA family hydrolase [Acinetobacter radioresistens]MCU4499027.1 HAD-IA family hydrolase [Acinetobacter radioresistens]
MLKLIMFDMDGTLLDLAFDDYIWNQCLPEHYAQFHGYSLEKSHQYLQQLYLDHKHTLNWYSSAFWSLQTGINILKMQQNHESKICLRPGSLELLEQLKAAGHVCWLVTNADCKSLELKLENILLRPHFDLIISSEQIGYPKETLAFWQYLQQQHSFNPEQAVLIDDTAQVLHSAKQFGIKNLFTILQPSSLQAPRLQEQLDYPAIDNLIELFPFISETAYKEINVKTA